MNSQDAGPAANIIMSFFDAGIKSGNVEDISNKIISDTKERLSWWKQHFLKKGDEARERLEKAVELLETEHNK